MSTRILIVLITITAVVSQLLLRRGLNDLGRPGDLAALPRFLGAAALSPWMYASLALQVLGYVMWMLLISRTKLGVATASVGSGFYVLMAFSAWALYGESLSGLQWAGILLVTGGVVCISLGAA